LSDEKDNDTSAKLIAWTTVPILWIMTGGMMIVHFVSFLTGATGIILLGAGIFIPPIGIVNALIFIFTGHSLGEYF
jgi:hypothetical protein